MCYNIFVNLTLKSNVKSHTDEFNYKYFMSDWIVCRDLNIAN